MKNLILISTMFFLSGFCLGLIANLEMFNKTLDMYEDYKTYCGEWGR